MLNSLFDENVQELLLKRFAESSRRYISHIAHSTWAPPPELHCVHCADNEAYLEECKYCQSWDEAVPGHEVGLR